MGEKLITVATFDTPIKAELAKNRLEEEGIPAFLGDEQTVGIRWHLGTALGGVKLQVSDEFADRAVAILEAPLDCAVSANEAEGLSEAIQAAELCPRCGKTVNPASSSCPACGFSLDDEEEFKPV